MAAPSQVDYLTLARAALRESRRSDEAEDLLQTVLLAAVEQGRTDLTVEDNRRWVAGALRKRARFDARTAVRRKRREANSTTLHPQPSPDPNADTSDFVRTLPQSLKVTTLLALTGHTRAEMGWLLGVSDATLRQRLAQVKKRWREGDNGTVADHPGLDSSLDWRIRQSLLPRTRDAVLGSHDPDGHLFVVPGHV